MSAHSNAPANRRLKSKSSPHNEFRADVRSLFSHSEWYFLGPSIKPQTGTVPLKIHRTPRRNQNNSTKFAFMVCTDRWHRPSQAHHLAPKKIHRDFLLVTRVWIYAALRPSRPTFCKTNRSFDSDCSHVLKLEYSDLSTFDGLQRSWTPHCWYHLPEMFSHFPVSNRFVPPLFKKYTFSLSIIKFAFPLIIRTFHIAAHFIISLNVNDLTLNIC